MSEAVNNGQKRGDKNGRLAIGKIDEGKDFERERADFEAAVDLHRAGERDSALQLCDQLLASGPSALRLPLVLHLRAVILAEQGYLLAASDCMREALNARPDIAAMHEHAARIHAALGLTEKAQADAESACRLAPENIAYRYQLARQLWLADDVDSAAREAQACLAEDPLFDEARILLSEIMVEQGQPHAAVAWLLPVVQRNPDHIRAWEMLSVCEPELVAGVPLQQALTRLAGPDNRTGTAARANFALARGALRRGESDHAFELFRAANELRADAEPFDIDGWEQRVARNLAVRDDTGHGLANSAANDEAGRRLVFVMGMPRSGTTLCEQVLSAHADVYGAGELPGMEQLSNEMQRKGLDADAPRHELEGIENLRDSYLNLLPVQSASYRRVIDKTPRNFERIELILSSFPAARVIWMLRHPLDTILSCYEQDFGPGHGFSNRLSHSARFYLGHARLLRSALRRHRKSIQVVDYSRFVTQLEIVVREMADFIGLPFDPAMLRPELNPRHVRTASSRQVRRPVYTTGIDRWRKVEHKLAPAIAVFEETGLIDEAGNSRMTSWLQEDSATSAATPGSDRQINSV